jgi:hypothetical protein
VNALCEKLSLHGEIKTTMVMQVTSAGFRVPGEPKLFILSAASKSPNAAANCAEDERSSQQASLLARQEKLPQEFFLSVAPAGQPWELYQANCNGGLKKVAAVAPGLAVSALHYNGHAQQLLCITNNFTMTTYAACEEGWIVLATMQFASRVPSSAAMTGEVHSVWTGVPVPANPSILSFEPFQSQVVVLSTKVSSESLIQTCMTKRPKPPRVHSLLTGNLERPLQHMCPEPCQTAYCSSQSFVGTYFKPPKTA